MKLLFILTLSLFIMSCTNNRTSELEKENAELRLQNENIELKHKQEELAAEEREKKDNAIMAEFSIWKEREKIKLEKMIKRGLLIEEYDNKRKNNLKTDEEKLEHLVSVTFNKQSLESHIKTLSELETNELYTQWYQQRLKGYDLKLVSDREYEWVDKPIGH